MKKAYKHFEYDGKTFINYSTIIDYALKLKGKKQKAFVEAYAAHSPFNLTNVGYMAGYYDSATAKKILTVFKSRHPLFGNSL